MRVTISLYCLMLLLKPVAVQAKPDHAKGILADADAVSHGSVTLKQQGGMVHGTIRISGMMPGFHAMHIHSTGQCRGDGFTAAGGHWNPQVKQHGLQNSMGAHLGDLAQITVGKDGKGKARFMLMSSLDQLLDADGAALIIHANPDDGMTDPSGNSGPRILCAVIG
ncbi:superoxide dismutase family protein [Sphingorhabdus sp. IMCC26285]|uniref:Superoxide dismutase family protein n=1 Tax=Sphingorhabdus profundilacus TaxID=2509718 RepID=A0A6I4LVN3_9SPHN|nr:superoxide dismutase family protein [Sphingorhabdus profundilacus]MVZ97597.1 superoxide dismutase family protein [Sphingorhabdus profundilacus]